MRIVALVFCILVCFGIPLGGSVYLTVKDRRLLKPILLGLAVFTVTQILIRIPLLQLVVEKTGWYSLLCATKPAVAALLLGFSAALFEEGGRLLAMSLFMKSRRSFADGIAFGLGHGGWEALFLVGIGLVAGAVASPATFPAEALFASGVERLLAMVCHIGFSVMVLCSVKTRKPWGFLLAMAAHTAMDFCAGMFGLWGLGMWWGEGVIAMFAVFSLVYIMFIKRRFEK